MQSYYYLGMQRLQQNKLIQALQQFDKHKPFDDCVKPLIKYSFNQNINTQEYVQRWLLQRVTNPQQRVDSLNILGCVLKKTKTQDALPYFIEALQLVKEHKLNNGPTLINITHSYSLLGEHEKALTYALQSLTETKGKQKIIAFHNTAVEYQHLKNESMSQQFHQEAYQTSKQLLGEEDELTLRMAKNVIPKKTQFRARSISRQSQPNQNTFYYRRRSTSKNSFLNQTLPIIQANNFIDKNDSYYQSKYQNVNTTKIIDFTQEFQQNQSDVESGTESEQEIMRQSQVQLLSQFSKDEKRGERIKFLLDIQQEYLEQLEFIQNQTLISNEIQLNGKVNESQQSILDVINELKRVDQTQDFDDTQERTAEYSETSKLYIVQNKNKTSQLRAACRIQRWYKKQHRLIKLKQPLDKQQLLNLVIKIQSLFRRKLVQFQNYQKPKYYYRKQKKLQFNQDTEKYFIIYIYLEQNTIKFVVCNKQKLRYIRQFNINEIQQQYNHFDEFEQIQQNVNLNYHAYQQKRSFNICRLINLLYIDEDQLQLYGITDTHQQLESTRLHQRNHDINTLRDNHKIIELQAMIRGKLNRNIYMIKQQEKKKSKRFIQKIDGIFYYLIFINSETIAAYNIGLRKKSKNVLKIPKIVIQFFGPLDRQNCEEIISIKNNEIQFSEDAQFIIDRDFEKNRKFDDKLLVKGVIKLQRNYRASNFRHYVDLLIQRRMQNNNQSEQLFCQKKSYVFQNYSGILVSQGTAIAGQQILTITGSVSCSDHTHPYIVPQRQRLFFPIQITELMQISKILLNQAILSVKDGRIIIQTKSIEEIQGFLKNRISEQSNSQREPTLSGRNYLSRNIYSRQYILNRSNHEFSNPQFFTDQYDAQIYQLYFMKNMLRYFRKQELKYIQDQKLILDIAAYVNQFQGQFMHVEEIIDPDIVLQIKLNRNAAMIQKAYRVYKFRMAIKTKIAQSRLRKPKPKPIVLKEYYYNLIQKPSPFDTKAILSQNNYSFINLYENQVNEVKIEWLLVLPYNDLVVTEYTHPRKFYQIKYQEYVSFYVDNVLQDTVECIQKYFLRPIQLFHPSEKLAFVFELREQFSRKVIRKVRMKLFRKKIREIPNFKKQLIRSFFTAQFIRVNYFYLKGSQKIRVFLQKDRKTHRTYEFDYFYLDQFYGKYHPNSQIFLQKSQFIQIITMNENKNYFLYSQLLLPIINLLHSYSYVNSNLELSYHPYEFPMQDVSVKKKKSYCQQESAQTSFQDISLIIMVQKKWKSIMQNLLYDQQKDFQKKLKIKLLAKKGKLIQRTYKKMSEISQFPENNEIVLVLIYRSEFDEKIQIRIEVLTLRSSQTNTNNNIKIFNVFYIDKASFIATGILYENIIQQMQIVNNTIQFKDTYEDNLEFIGNNLPLKLITSKPSTPKLIFHQKRQYEDGNTFLYDAIHTGNHPIQLEEENLIKVNVDLKEFRTQYPQLDYRREDILPRISEQIIKSMKIKQKGRMAARSMLKSSILKISGNSKICESEINNSQISEESTQITVYQRFTQFFQKQRYMISISLEDILINTIAKSAQDSIIQHYQSKINVKVINLINGNQILWQMSLQDAEQLTNEKQIQFITLHLKSNIQVLDKKVLYVCRYKQINFDNVLMMPYKLMIRIQRLIRNRKFRLNRQLFESEYKSFKTSDNRFYKNVYEIYLILVYITIFSVLERNILLQLQLIKNNIKFLLGNYKHTKDFNSLFLRRINQQLIWSKIQILITINWYCFDNIYILLLYMDKYIKIVIVGDSGVGKTQMLNSYCFGLNPTNEQDYTIGCDYVLKRVLINGQFVKLQIWDISGAERSSPLMKLYLKGSLGVIFVFDATSNQSRQNLIKWKETVLTYVDEYNGRHIPFLVVGNKLDLIQQQFHEHQENQGQIEQFCNTNSFQEGLFVSSYTREGLNEAFETIVEEIIRRDLITLQIKKNASRINKLQIQDMNVNLKGKDNCMS